MVFVELAPSSWRRLHASSTPIRAEPVCASWIIAETVERNAISRSHREPDHTDDRDHPQDAAHLCGKLDLLLVDSESYGGVADFIELQPTTDNRIPPPTDNRIPPPS